MTFCRTHETLICQSIFSNEISITFWCNFPLSLYLAAISVLLRVMQRQALAKNMMSSALDAIKTVIIPIYFCYYSTYLSRKLIFTYTTHTKKVSNEEITSIVINECCFSCAFVLVTLYSPHTHTLSFFDHPRQIILFEINNQSSPHFFASFFFSCALFHWFSHLKIRYVQITYLMR